MQTSRLKSTQFESEGYCSFSWKQKRVTGSAFSKVKLENGFIHPLEDIVLKTFNDPI